MKLLEMTMHEDRNVTLTALLQEAGGEKDIIVYTCPNENAVGFYEKLGMEHADDVMTLNHIDWTDFTVE